MNFTYMSIFINLTWVVQRSTTDALIKLVNDVCDSNGDYISTLSTLHVIRFDHFNHSSSLSQSHIGLHLRNWFDHNFGIAFRFRNELLFGRVHNNHQHHNLAFLHTPMPTIFTNISLNIMTIPRTHSTPALTTNNHIYIGVTNPRPTFAFFCLHSTLGANFSALTDDFPIRVDSIKTFQRLFHFHLTYHQYYYGTYSI